MEKVNRIGQKKPRKINADTTVLPEKKPGTRKLRIINENVDEPNEWLEATKSAYKNTYAYEWQGDSLFLARESMLISFIDKEIDYPIAEFSILCRVLNILVHYLTIQRSLLYYLVVYGNLQQIIIWLLCFSQNTISFLY